MNFNIINNIKKNQKDTLTIYSKKDSGLFYYILNGEYRGLFNFKSFFDIFLNPITPIFSFSSISSNILTQNIYPPIKYEKKVTLTLLDVTAVDYVNTLIPEKTESFKKIKFLYHDNNINIRELHINDLNKSESYYDLKFSRRRKYTKIEHKCIHPKCNNLAIGSHIFSNSNELKSFNGSFYKLDRDNSGYISTHKKIKMIKKTKQKEVKRVSEPTKNIFCSNHDLCLFKNLDKCNNKEINKNYAEELTLRNASSSLFEFRESLINTKNTKNFINNFNSLDTIPTLIFSLIKNNEKDRLCSKIKILEKSIKKLEAIISEIINGSHNYIFKIINWEDSSDVFIGFSTFDDDFSFISATKTKEKNNFILLSIRKDKENSFNYRHKDLSFILSCLKSNDLIVSESFLEKYFNYNRMNSEKNFNNELNLKNPLKQKGFLTWLSHVDINKKKFNI